MKKGQSEVITTVLLVLVAIAAIAIVGIFIYNQVKSSISDVEIRNQVSQIQIDITNALGGNNYTILQRNSNNNTILVNLTVFVNGDKKNIDFASLLNWGSLETRTINFKDNYILKIGDKIQVWALANTTKAIPVLIAEYTVSKNANVSITVNPSVNAPTNLIAKTVSGRVIDISWTDNSNNEESFKIERSSDTLSWDEIDSVELNTKYYSDTELSLNTKYYYRVRAYNESIDYSGYSNVASNTTLDYDFLVSDCTQPLAQSDSTYKLTNNLACSLKIAENGITINGAGYSITGNLNASTNGDAYGGLSIYNINILGNVIAAGKIPVGSCSYGSNGGNVFLGDGVSISGYIDTASYSCSCDANGRISGNVSAGNNVNIGSIIANGAKDFSNTNCGNAPPLNPGATVIIGSNSVVENISTIGGTSTYMGSQQKGGGPGGNVILGNNVSIGRIYAMGGNTSSNSRPPGNGGNVTFASCPVFKPLIINVSAGFGHVSGAIPGTIIPSNWNTC